MKGDHKDLEGLGRGLAVKLRSVMVLVRFSSELKSNSVELDSEVEQTPCLRFWHLEFLCNLYSSLYEGLIKLMIWICDQEFRVFTKYMYLCIWRIKLKP